MNDKIMQFKTYLREQEKSNNTVEKYLRDVNEFYLWHGEGKKITKSVANEYKDYLKKTSNKISTINSKISSLNAYFTFLKNENLKLKIIKCQKTFFYSKERELTIKDYKRLYSACNKNERLKMIIETIAKTGIRVSEISYITFESIALGRVIIENKGKVRTILIPRTLGLTLRQYCLKNGIKKGVVFITRNNSPYNRKQIWKMMKDLANLARVDKNKVFPHNLRHLFAREFYNETHDIVKLASILGHSNIETTRIYTKEMEEVCRLQMEKVNYLLSYGT